MLCRSKLCRMSVCASALLMAGCFPSMPRTAETSMPVQNSDAIAKVDREIQQLETKIRGTRDDINQMVLEDFEVKQQLRNRVNFPYSTDYAMTGGQNPGDSNMGRVVRITQNLEAARKVLDQQQKELEKLTKQKQSLQQQSMGCFPAQTLVVMADGSTRPFDQVRVGDVVQTYDIGYEKSVARKVVDVYQVDGNHLYQINGELRTSGGERLLSQDGWRPVRNLRVGDSVHVGGRMVQIERIELSRDSQRLYNMQVADTHNFFVAMPGLGTVLVHNSGGGGGGGGK